MCSPAFAMTAWLRAQVGWGWSSTTLHALPRRCGPENEEVHVCHRRGLVPPLVSRRLLLLLSRGWAPQRRRGSARCGSIAIQVCCPGWRQQLGSIMESHTCSANRWAQGSPGSGGRAGACLHADRAGLFSRHVLCCVHLLLHHTHTQAMMTPWPSSWRPTTQGYICWASARWLATRWVRGGDAANL